MVTCCALWVINAEFRCDFVTNVAQRMCIEQTFFFIIGFHISVYLFFYNIERENKRVKERERERERESVSE